VRNVRAGSRNLGAGHYRRRIMSIPVAITVVLADPMDGVRDAWRDLLAGQADVHVAGEAASVAQALATAGAVVLAGLRFPDGTAADLIAQDPRPVVVWTFLPEDERRDVSLDGAVAVLKAGTLRTGLLDALRRVAPQ